MRKVQLPVPEAADLKRGALIVVGISVALILAYLVREIWVPLALSFILAMVLDPIVDRMQLRGWSRMSATAFIFGSFVTIVAGLLILSYPFVVSQFQTLQGGFEKYFPDSTHDGLVKSFQHLGLSHGLANDCVAGLDGIKLELQHSSNSIASYGMSAAANAIWIVIVPIVAFYALRDFHVILAKGLLIMPAKHRDLVQVAVTEITLVFGKFLRGLAIVSVLNGVATAVLLYALHVPGSLILGIVAGLLYTVPYVGALVTIAITAAVAFVSGGLHLAIVSVGSSLVLHQIVFDQIISPRIIGGQVGLHPILSIIALLSGNILLGIVGMILAVPVAACVQIGVLAIAPKLSKRVEIASLVKDPDESVPKVEESTQEAMTEIDAVQETRDAVNIAVEAIEKEVEAESRGA